MGSAVRRCRWTRRPWRALPLAPAFVALTLMAGAGAAQDEGREGGEASRAIEISADTLEVRQSEHVAVFQGSVKAVQGDMVLSADMLTVHYREVQEGESNLGVSRIEAEGNVVVSSPQETARGRRGVYDMDRSRIELIGDVVLNQGNNVIAGETLTMDLASGVSRVVGGDSERVTGLFVPEDEDE